MDTKRPKHCRGCVHWHRAGHPKGSKLSTSKYQNWCCAVGNHAPKAVSVCLHQKLKREGQNNDTHPANN